METLTFTSHETEGIIQIFMIALVMVGSIVRKRYDLSVTCPVQDLANSP